MRILVTGANGFIGRHISDFLGERHEVWRIVRPGSIGQFERTIEVDLSLPGAASKDFLTQEITGLKIDTIIHCAAVLATAGNSKSIETFHVNVRITESVIAIASAISSKRLVNLSTIGVYPNQSGKYTEDSCVSPSNNSEALYSLAKFCSEELFNFFLKDTEVVNLRLAQTIGHGMRDDRIYSLFKEELQKENVITVWGNGERVSNFMSIRFLCDVIRNLVEAGDVRGLYNVGEENISYLEVARRVIRDFGNKDSKLVMVDSGNRSSVNIDCSRLKAFL